MIYQHDIPIDPIVDDVNLYYIIRLTAAFRADAQAKKPAGREEDERSLCLLTIT